MKRVEKTKTWKPGGESSVYLGSGTVASFQLSRVCVGSCRVFSDQRGLPFPSPTREVSFASCADCLARSLHEQTMGMRNKLAQIEGVFLSPVSL